MEMIASCITVCMVGVKMEDGEWHGRQKIKDRKLEHLMDALVQNL